MISTMIVEFKCLGIDNIVKCKSLVQAAIKRISLPGEKAISQKWKPAGNP